MVHIGSMFSKPHVMPEEILQQMTGTYLDIYLDYALHISTSALFFQALASISFGDLLMISLRGKNHKPCGPDAYQKCNIFSIIFAIECNWKSRLFMILTLQWT